MTSYGDEIFTKDIHSTGTIYWHDFSPPLENEGVPTLSAVLEAGNDANHESILNVGKIEMDKDDNNILNDASITGASTVQCQTLTTTFATSLDVTVGDDLSLGTALGSGGTITFNAQASQDATSITGPSATNLTTCTNLDLSHSSNKFPTSIDDDTLKDVLVRGSDADQNNITNVNFICCRP